jgi:hypothetical protein
LEFTNSTAKKQNKKQRLLRVLPWLWVSVCQMRLGKEMAAADNILVIENNVRLPDPVCWDTKGLNSIIFLGVPAQFIIIPDLKEKSV